MTAPDALRRLINGLRALEALAATGDGPTFVMAADRMAALREELEALDQTQDLPPPAGDWDETTPVVRPPIVAGDLLADWAGEVMR